MAEETLRFGSGGDALRSEDEPLLSGRGREVGWLSYGMAACLLAYFVFVRARIAG